MIVNSTHRLDLGGWQRGVAAATPGGKNMSTWQFLEMISVYIAARLIYNSMFGKKKEEKKNE